jgi:hypothetical protein
MLKSLAIESLIEASAVQSLVGCTRLYGLHKALQAEQSPTGCTKPYRLNEALQALQAEQSLTG